MIASLLLACVVLTASGDPLAQPDVTSSIAASAMDTSGGSVCLLQREGSQIRSDKEKTKTEEHLAPHALATAGAAVEAAGNASEAPATAAAASEAHNASETQPLPVKEQALQQRSSSSSSSSSSSKVPGLAGSSAAHAGHLTAGVSEGMGIDYTAQALSQISILKTPLGQEQSKEAPEKNKIALMIIEMCPLCWLLAIDRFYLGNVGLAIAKLSVSLCTCGVGGFVWGLVDFIVIIVNALRKDEMLHAAGMSARFPKSQVGTAFILALVDIAMIFVFMGLARLIWWWRKQQRMEKLKAAAMRSPHYGVDPRQVKGG